MREKQKKITSKNLKTRIPKQITQWPRGPISWQKYNHEVDLPPISLTGRGISFSGIHFPIDILKRTPFLALFIALANLPRVAGNKKDNFYRSFGETLYLLSLGGGEKLGKAVDKLNAGGCDGLVPTDADFNVQDAVLIRTYFPYSISSQAFGYSAVLYRNREGTTNNTVVDCITGALEEAHAENQINNYSPKNIALGVLSIFLFCSIAFAFSYLWRSKYCCKKEEKYKPDYGYGANGTLDPMYRGIESKI